MAATTPATTAEFLDLVRRTGLIPQVPTDLPDAPDRAAGELVRRKLLTPFQARMILAGRTRGFVLGDYVIKDQIGQGGMGFVYLGVHRTLGRKAAVKVLPPSIAGEQIARQRFLREARTAAALDHPNVVKLYDVARDEEVWYLVMEFVEGETLDHVVTTRGPLHYSRAVGYVAQAAAGLQHAFEKGFIHRDIKPGNLILTPEGGVKILDMGLARPVGPEGTLTVANDPAGTFGTADYISPEQVVSEPDIDIRADIYCLGLTFFFLVTGRPPFQGHTASKLVQQKLAQLPDLTELVDHFPPGLAQVIAGMTAKHREERYETPADVILALKPWLEQSPKLMAGVSGTRAANDRLSTQAMQVPGPRQPAEREKKGPPVWVWAAVGGVLLAVAAGGVAVALAMMNKGTTPTTGPQPTQPATPPTTEPAPATKPAPPTKPATPPTATTPLPPATGIVIYEKELAGLTPFEVVLTNNGGTVAESATGSGKYPDGWTATTWAAGNKVRAFGTADGLGTKAEQGSAILFAPVQPLDGKVPAVRVTVEYRSTTADKKLDLRVREVGSKDNVVKYLPPTGGEWKTAEIEFDTTKIAAARFEFHNQDTSKDAKFEVRKFSVRAVK